MTANWMDKKISKMIQQEELNPELEYDEKFQDRSYHLMERSDQLSRENRKPENVMGRWVAVMVKLEAMKAANATVSASSPIYCEEHFLNLLEDSDE